MRTSLKDCLYRYYARVQKVYPPKAISDTDLTQGQSSSSPFTPPPPPHEERAHMIGGDLKIPAKDANAKDDPAKYYYGVQVLELEKERSHDKNRSITKGPGKEDSRTGSIMEVQCNLMR